jgi:enterochelin esterase family protein
MLANEDFGNDLSKDLIPYVEANFRVLNATASRAMAGLSMGGRTRCASGSPAQNGSATWACSAWD